MSIIKMSLNIIVFLPILSFGALFWECLTRCKPWSWITDSTIQETVCDEGQRLPLLLDWPGTIIRILKCCLGPEDCRSQLTDVRETLLQLKPSVWSIKDDDLDDAFNMWCYGKRRTSVRGRSLTGSFASRISWKISSLSIGNEETEDDSKLLVLCSRRSTCNANLKKRRKTGIDIGKI